MLWRVIGGAAEILDYPLEVVHALVEDRNRAVKLYIKLGKRTAATIRPLLYVGNINLRVLLSIKLARGPGIPKEAGLCYTVVKEDFGRTSN